MQPEPHVVENYTALVAQGASTWEAIAKAAGEMGDHSLAAWAASMCAPKIERAVRTETKSAVDAEVIRGALKRLRHRC